MDSGLISRLTHLTLTDDTTQFRCQPSTVLLKNRKETTKPDGASMHLVFELCKFNAIFARKQTYLCPFDELIQGAGVEIVSSAHDPSLSPIQSFLENAHLLHKPNILEIRLDCPSVIIWDLVGMAS